MISITTCGPEFDISPCRAVPMCFHHCIDTIPRPFTTFLVRGMKLHDCTTLQVVETIAYPFHPLFNLKRRLCHMSDPFLPALQIVVLLRGMYHAKMLKPRRIKTPNQRPTAHADRLAARGRRPTSRSTVFSAFMFIPEISLEGGDCWEWTFRIIAELKTVAR